MQFTYEELCPLNQTNSGEIYLVRQKESGLLAVKKTVEVRLYPLYEQLQCVRHPNLMQVIEVELQEDVCVVMEEYIAGETLAAILSQGMRFDEQNAEQYLRMLCSAVRTLHESQIIHRDITPNNIMLTTDGLLKLCDYDISRIQKNSRQRDTQLLGTYGYAAPEQFGYGQTDQQSDIYAMGMLINTMLTGSEEVLYRRYSRLGRVIAKAVAIDRKDRYVSVAQMEEALAVSDTDKGGVIGNFIRCIPGFRTLNPWQMLLALLGYPLAVCFSWFVSCSYVTGYFANLIFFVFPWILYLDLFHVSWYLLKLEPGQRWFRVLLGVCIRILGLVIYMQLPAS